jgi:hypothetical protein
VDHFKLTLSPTVKPESTLKNNNFKKLKDTKHHLEHESLVHRSSIVVVLELFALAFFSAASARGQ